MAVITFKASPFAVIVKIIGTVITSVLPIVTTYFAALTTTALVDAYAGKPAAGNDALRLVIVTALLGVILTGWNSLEQYINQLAKYKINAAVNDRMYEHFFEHRFLALRRQRNSRFI